MHTAKNQGRHPHHRASKKRGWLRKVGPVLFSNLCAPLVVGLALQGIKGCDRLTLEASAPGPARPVAREGVHPAACKSAAPVAPGDPS
jgi:hypothetical protein